MLYSQFFQTREYATVYQWDGTEVTELGGSLMHHPHPDDSLFDVVEEPEIREMYLRAPMAAFDELHKYNKSHLQNMPWVANTVPTTEWDKKDKHIPSRLRSLSCTTSRPLGSRIIAPCTRTASRSRRVPSMSTTHTCSATGMMRTVRSIILCVNCKMFEFCVRSAPEASIVRRVRSETKNHKRRV